MFFALVLVSGISLSVWCEFTELKVEVERVQVIGAVVK